MLSILDDLKRNTPQTFDGFAEFLKQAEEYSDDSEFSDDIGSAKEFISLLETLGNKWSSNLKNSPDLENRFRLLLTKLRWMDPFSLDTNWQENLLSNNLIAAIKNGWEPLAKVEDWLFLSEAGLQPDQKRRSEAMTALAKNSEYIGTGIKIDLLDQQGAVPTVGNWIKDYLASLPQNKDLVGGFDKINYLTNSKNVSKLNAADKQILTQVIDIYNELKNPNPEILRGIAQSKPAARPVPKPAAPKFPVPPVPPATHGQDLEVLKRKLEENKVSFAVKNPVAAKPIPAPVPAVKMTIEEIKRETGTKELPPPPKAAAPVIAAVKPAPSVPKMNLGTLNDIHTMEDLKKVEVGHLRQGPIPAQAAIIKNKIIILSEANRLLPYYAVSAFEQSPLFKSYIAVGGNMIHDVAVDRVAAFKEAAAKAGSNLTLPEFEAIADLRKEIEKL